MNPKDSGDPLTVPPVPPAVYCFYLSSEYVSQQLLHGLAQNFVQTNDFGDPLTFPLVLPLLQLLDGLL